MTLTERERIQELYGKLGLAVPAFVSDTWAIPLMEALIRRVVELETKANPFNVRYFGENNNANAGCAPAIVGDGHGNSFKIDAVATGLNGKLAFAQPDLTFMPVRAPIRETEDLEILSHMIEGADRRGFSVAHRLDQLGIVFVSYESGGTCSLGRVTVYSDTVPASLPQWLRRLKVGHAA